MKDSKNYQYLLNDISVLKRVGTKTKNLLKKCTGCPGILRQAFRGSNDFIHERTKGQNLIQKPNCQDIVIFSNLFSLFSLFVHNLAT